MATESTETPPDDDNDRPDNITTELPDAVIEYLPPGDLVPWEHNANLHEAEQIQRIARSIQEFGFTSPVLIRDGDILAGHARVMAAEYLGMTRVPTIDLAHLTHAQARAYVLADNRLAELSDWNFDIVATEFDALVDAGFDVEITGFSHQDRLEFKDVVADHDGEGGAGTHGDGEATGAFRCPTCGQFTATDFSAD